MMHDDRIDPAQSGVLVIDVQERLLSAMDDALVERHLGRMIAMVGGAQALGMPIVCTEQYPRGLGPTVAPLAEAIGDVERHAKKTFSCMKDVAISEAIESAGKLTWIVIGMETHICVLQTVRDLREAGYEVHLAADGCLSRDPLDYQVGIERAAGLGAHITSVETALFDCLGEAGGEAFKTISRLIR